MNKLFNVYYIYVMLINICLVVHLVLQQSRIASQVKY